MAIGPIVYSYWPVFEWNLNKILILWLLGGPDTRDPYSHISSLIVAMGLHIGPYIFFRHRLNYSVTLYISTCLHIYIACYEMDHSVPSQSRKLPDRGTLIDVEQDQNVIRKKRELKSCFSYILPYSSGRRFSCKLLKAISQRWHEGLEASPFRRDLTFALSFVTIMNI